jgi:predicted glycoside hydrolase/deacetylase ChbG (UPF0249 family)
MKALLITADDFGLTAGATEGIVESICNGAVAATTAMLCVEGAAENIARLAPQIPGRIGLHLQLTDGVPLCDPATLRTLVGTASRFPRKPPPMPLYRKTEVEREWYAQLAALRALGIEPSHLDSHHHIHRAPVAFDVYCDLALALGVSARGAAAAFFPGITDRLRKRGVACADAFIGHWAESEPTVDRLIALVAEASDEVGENGIVEMMCHPAYADDELRNVSSYVEEREQELRSLCAPELPERLRAIGFELVTLDDLAQRAKPA